MNFDDATLVRLAEESSRREIFDEVALEQLIDSAYDTQAMTVEGPYQPIFDEFQLGVAVPRVGTLEGVWATVGANDKVEARFQVSGLGRSDVIRVDALWRGAIVARTVPATSEITEVDVTWPDLASIDADIIAVEGSLPVDPEDLEQERRTRLISRIQAALEQPELLTDEVLDQWLSGVGASTVGELLTELQRTVQGAAVQVRFSPPQEIQPSPMRLPIVAALLIRDTGFSVTQLLMESKLVREQLESVSVHTSSDPSLKLRYSLIVVWIFPESVFEDDDWTGGNPGMEPSALFAARRAEAGRWLAREGIGLVVTS